MNDETAEMTWEDFNDTLSELTEDWDGRPKIVLVVAPSSEQTWKEYLDLVRSEL